MNVVKLADPATRDVRPFAFHKRDDGDTPATLDRHESEPGSGDSKEEASTPDADADRNDRPALQQRIAELENALGEMAERAKADRASAFEDGREKGRKEAGTREDERLQALGKSLEETHGDVLAMLDSRHDVAIDIARAALSRILGEESAFAAMVTETAALWRAKLTETTVLEARVSGRDFPDEEKLAPLQASLGSIAVNVDPDLEPGSCRFGLTLGEVDASLAVQAARADRLLAEHGTPNQAEADVP